jgi:two-component system nitrate/nitrite response regulator NarL
MMSKIFLYSDYYQGHCILTDGLNAVLKSAGSFELECLSCALPEAPARLRAEAPDVLVLDLSEGAIASALGSFREAAPTSAMVLWVESISPTVAFEAMRTGVRGILRKNLPASALLSCLEKVAAGGLWFEKALTDSITSSARVPIGLREGQSIALLTRATAPPVPNWL